MLRVLFSERVICLLASCAGNVELAVVYSCNEEPTALQVAAVGAKTYTRVLWALAEVLSPSSAFEFVRCKIDSVERRGPCVVRGRRHFTEICSFAPYLCTRTSTFLYNQSSSTAEVTCEVNENVNH